MRKITVYVNNNLSNFEKKPNYSLDGKPRAKGIMKMKMTIRQAYHSYVFFI